MQSDKSALVLFLLFFLWLLISQVSLHMFTHYSSSSESEFAHFSVRLLSFLCNLIFNPLLIVMANMLQVSFRNLSIIH